jgi:methylthioribose-1-phosphate isomerase
LCKFKDILPFCLIAYISSKMERLKPAFPNGSIWFSNRYGSCTMVIDQRFLPFKKTTFKIRTIEEASFAIREMVVRGAPLIGVTAAYGIYHSFFNSGNNSLEMLTEAAEYLNSSRPTAINLFTATHRMVSIFDPVKTRDENLQILLKEANKIREEEIDICQRIGMNGLSLIEEIHQKKAGEPVQILTHCNAGWLACVKYGTATAPLYLAHEKGIPIHVWVDETRPRNQGARLTAYELGLAGIPHTVIADNTGGHLMQHGMVDLVITGSDRTTLNGDTANKTGTYLKALAAFDNHIPFYVALPSTSIDWNMEAGIQNIPVEERSPEEVETIEGWSGRKITRVRLIPEKSKAANYAFDVTPARLITGLITERGVCAASKEGISSLFPLASANGKTISNHNNHD